MKPAVRLSLIQAIYRVKTVTSMRLEQEAGSVAESAEQLPKTGRHRFEIQILCAKQFRTTAWL